MRRHRMWRWIPSFKIEYSICTLFEAECQKDRKKMIRSLLVNNMVEFVSLFNFKVKCFFYCNLSFKLSRIFAERRHVNWLPSSP